MIYLLTLIMLAFFAFKYDFLKTHDGKPGLIEKGSYNVALISLIAIAGLRYKVGGDTFTYMESFEDIPFIWDFKNFDFSTATFDPLWFVFSSISKSIINDFVFFQILHAIFINVIIFKFFKKFTSFKFTAVLIYYLFLYEYFNMEIMRESLAICMLLLSYSFLETKKWYKYYLYALIGFLFHSSAIAMLILPLLYNRKFKLVPVLILSALLLIILLLPEEFKTIMSLALFNDRLSTRFFLYSEVSLNQNGVLLLAVVYILVPGLLILLSERYLIGKPVFRKMYFAYFRMAIIILGFSGFTRFINYYSIFMAVYLANILNRLYRTRLFFHYKKLAVVSLLVFTFSQKIIYYFTDTSQIVVGTHRYNTWYPYNSVFSKEENFNREDLYYGIMSSQ